MFVRHVPAKAAVLGGVRPSSGAATPAREVGRKSQHSSYRRALLWPGRPHSICKHALRRRWRLRL